MPNHSLQKDEADGEVFDDLPPSYFSAVSQDVDDSSTKEYIDQNKSVVQQQPRTSSADSLELSKRCSLNSTKFSIDSSQLLPAVTPVKRPANNRNAWNEKIVIRNIYERDQVSFLCFCATALGAIAVSALYCSYF